MAMPIRTRTLILFSPRSAGLGSRRRCSNCTDTRDCWKRTTSRGGQREQPEGVLIDSKVSSAQCKRVVALFSNTLTLAHRAAGGQNGRIPDRTEQYV